MKGPEDMHPPRFENKVNWTTAIALAGLAFTILVTVGGWVYTTGQFRAQFDGLSSHVSVENARADTRLQAAEAGLRAIENLTYRVTLIEQANAAINATLSDLNRVLSEQGADIRVIREILTRVDRQTVQ